MNEKLRILLSGAGLMGRKHAQLVTMRPDCALVAVVSPSSEQNRLFAAEFGSPLFSSVSDALTNVHVDAVIISSPNEFHFDQAIECIARGIPALVEKPITDKLTTARALAEESETRQVPILVGHHRTYSPLLDAARSFIHSAKFGRLVAMQGSALFYKPAHYFVEGIWRTKIGGGPILINLIHEIGIMRHLCGEIRRLTALAGNHIRSFEVEDTVAICLEFDSGALGTFLLSDTAASSKSWEMTSGENPVYPSFPQQNCYHFAGTNGSLDFPSLNTRHYPPETTPSWWSAFANESIQFSRADPLELQLNHFVRVARGIEKPQVSARDGFQNMLVVEAINRSIATGTTVDVGGAATA
jgi:predicted dehydrogenase